MTAENTTQRRGRLANSVSPAGRDEMINFVADELRTTKADAALIVATVTSGIAKLVHKHKLIRVPNLGTFRILDTPSRDGRNPRTGEIVPIEPGQRVSFRATRSLKTCVKQTETSGK